MDPMKSINWSLAEKRTGNSGYIKAKRKEFLRNRELFRHNRPILTEEQQLAELSILSLERQTYFNDFEFVDWTNPSTLRNFKSEFIKDFICCGNKFEDFEKYCLHVETYHKKQEVCNKKNNYLDFDALNGINHDNLKEICSCPLSLKPDISVEYLLIHSQKHMANPYFKEFPCPHINCKKVYKNPNGYKYHIKNGHKKNLIPKKYPCSVPSCHKSFKNKNGLRYHLTHFHD
ncbi:hypothetical protein CWI39_0369p0030 [Hamiltosporidium magnivora]|uniref:C2H2-type domain-containing protein n=1 Tax=Hamiltosporidium magnivora TaxID=148818 RepID=A0A4Q9LHZ3_9MICR|nr:hypothetical protein CWI36_0715p0010 [Hamiltosporidium magnivora]TBU07115.1 hypothetical protein CWI39_0369p0030 [Hamiltosporidium magnivora]